MVTDCRLVVRVWFQPENQLRLWRCHLNLLHHLWGISKKLLRGLPQATFLKRLIFPNTGTVGEAKGGFGGGGAKPSLESIIAIFFELKMLRRIFFAFFFLNLFFAILNAVTSSYRITNPTILY